LAPLALTLSKGSLMFRAGSTEHLKLSLDYPTIRELICGALDV